MLQKCEEVQEGWILLQDALWHHLLWFFNRSLLLGSSCAEPDPSDIVAWNNSHIAFGDIYLQIIWLETFCELLWKSVTLASSVSSCKSEPLWWRMLAYLKYVQMANLIIPVRLYWACFWKRSMLAFRG